jgi:hypothetical protein
VPEGRYLKAVFCRVEGSGPGPRDGRTSESVGAALPTP